MKNLKSYIFGAMALVAASASLTACQDHFDEPNSEEAPVADITANTTIREIKELGWKDKDNYCEQIYTKEWYDTPADQRTEEMKTQGTHIVVKGRVVSSDFAGNCFKYIVLQDETGALNFSINSYNLYLQYRRGQEVLVDLTGLYAGKYRGLFQIGFPSYNSSLIDPTDPYNQPYETSFMAPEFFRRNAELNGWPERADIDTVLVDRFSDIGVTPAELRKWQSQLVRFNNVEFVQGTLGTLSTWHSSGETQTIKDADGNTLDLRTSGYANFWNMRVPEERCDVVALMGYYVNLAGTGGWQLTLLDANSILNVGHPTSAPGSKDNPYTVQQAVALQVNDAGKSGWVKGYIVGTVAPEIETVSSSSDIEWGADATLGNTMVIGQTPDTKDIADCLVIALPQGSALYGQSLRANPSNYQKEITIKGTFAAVMNTYGITGNNGSSSEFIIEGQEPVKPVEGDGTEAKPYSVAQVIAKGSSANEPGVWVAGYIVGSCVDKSYSSATFTADGASNTNLLMADAPDCTDASKCIPVAIAIPLRDGLSLQKNPGNLGKKLDIKGDIIKYFGVPGLKETIEYKLNGAGGGDTPTPSPDAVTLLGSKDANGSKDWTYDNVLVPAGFQYSIWGWTEYSSNYYLKASAYSDNTAHASEAWAISPVINLAGNSSVTATFDHAAKFQTTLRTLCGFAVREVGATTWTMLSVPTWPEAGSWTYVNSGNISLSAYAGKKIQVAFKYASNSSGADTWQVRDLKLSGDGTITIEGAGETPNPPTPPTPSETYKGDFDTFNNSTPNSKYGTYTNATGWTLENGMVLAGQEAGKPDTNPRFAFIGSPTTLAPTLNGKTTTPGKLTSPELTGGCGKLTFKYGYAFTETKGSFIVNVIQNGAVVKTQTVTVDPVEKLVAKDFSLDVNIKGNFKIEIVNGCLSQSSSNKDRVSIWNLTWTE